MSRHTFDPADLGEHINVPFAATSAANAKLVWINERWLIGSGSMSFETAARAEISARILHDFAVRAVESATISQDSPRQLMADRYGGTGGTVHGGSGRCGSKDGFIAKGIGKTPLASELADLHHANGLMSLAEALKEAVCAEVAHHELPWGAIPAVAVIDAGFDFPAPGSGEPRRAAILVRPVFVRPAHFERSIFFGAAGTRDSAQFQDALRVESAIATVTARGDLFPSLTEMFRRFAQQIGAARARRLWQGRFLTSNVSIDGALVDFGSFRSMPHWRKSIGLAGECFGGEIHQLRRGFLSVASYFAKYAPRALDDVDLRGYIRELHRIEERAFLDTCLACLGVDPTQDTLAAATLSALLSEYFRVQQSQRVGANVMARGPWIYEALCAEPDPNRQNRTRAGWCEAHLEQTIRAAAADSSNEGISLDKARRFFGPRRPLWYDVMERKTRRAEALIRRCPSAATAIASSFIDRQVCKCVAWSSLIPRRFDVRSVHANVYSAIVLCRRKHGGPDTFWVQGALRGADVLLLGRQISRSELDHSLVRLHNDGIGFEVPASAYREGALKIGKHVFPLDADVCYRWADVA